MLAGLAQGRTARSVTFSTATLSAYPRTAGRTKGREQQRSSNGIARGIHQGSKSSSGTARSVSRL